MIEFTIGKTTRIIIDFTFFATISLFFYFDKSGWGIIGICACVIHEIGHLAALYVEKGELKSLTFYGGGIKIGYGKKADASVFLIVAGSLMNFIIFAVFYFITPQNYELKLFAVLNLIIGLFNLIPLQQFDGGRLLQKALNGTGNREKNMDKTKTIIITAAIITAIFIIAINRINPSVLIITAYILASDVAVKRKQKEK